MSDEQTMSLDKFERLGDELFQVNLKLQEIDTKRKQVAEKKEELQAKVMAVLKDLDKTSHRFKHCAVTLKQQASVATPKSAEDKEKLFQWLKSKGEEVFLHYASVNSQSLNALYRSERDIAAKEGNINWEMPGVGKESIYYSLSVRTL